MNDPLTLYTLTRAAVTDHERQWAWTDFYSHVMPYAIGWARRQPAFRHVGEWSYVLAHDGIARLWRGTGGDGGDRADGY